MDLILYSLQVFSKGACMYAEPLLKAFSCLCSIISLPASEKLQVDQEQVFTAYNDYFYNMSHKQNVLSGRVGAIVSSYFVGVLHLK